MIPILMLRFSPFQSTICLTDLPSRVQIASLPRHIYPNTVLLQQGVLLVLVTHIVQTVAQGRPFLPIIVIGILRIKNVPQTCLNVQCHASLP